MFPILQQCCAVVALAPPAFIPPLSLLHLPPRLLHFCTFPRFCTSPSSLYPSAWSPSSCYPASRSLSLFLGRNLASTLFTLACRSRENYNSYPGLRLSLQIMTSDLCLYHVFSGTLFTRLAGASRSLQHNTAIQ